MNQEEILNELLELILSVDQTETDVQKLHEDMHPHLRAIAEWLFIAKTDVRIEVPQCLRHLRADGRLRQNLL